MPDLSLGLTPQIIAACERRNLTIPETAYVLATGRWETNHTMEPVEEAYYLGSRAQAYRDSLRYAPWWGRGLVQLTWEANYIRAGQGINADLINHPEAAMEPGHAVEILVAGMAEGWFTGKRLSQYITRDRVDYVGARRIINGTDCAAQIADLALSYEHALTPAPDYPCIRRGSRGAAVREAQTLLAALGYAVGALDGVFGSLTHAATVAFQRSEALTADGIIGPKTWAALLPDN